MKDYHRLTRIIRSENQRSAEQEHSEAIFLTSSFVFKNAEQAQAIFAKKELGNVYSRFTNPTVRIFEKRLAVLEDAEACVATNTGMTAVFATVMALCRSGDHIVASYNMFGTTVVLLEQIISEYGITVSFVNLCDLSAWTQAIKSNTKLFLLETPSNPLGDIVDLKTLAKLAQSHNILLAVDNILPVLQKPLALGADIVIYSATKYIDGQGRSLAGAILGKAAIIEQIITFMRSTGLILNPFNAWIVLKGLETLPLRMKAHSDNALKIAKWLTKQKKISRVYYLGLPTHEKHQLAKTQQSGFGGIIAFVVSGGKKAAFSIINQTRICSITANFGDVKTTITHPSTTTHSRLSDLEKIKANIDDGLIRLSIGLEDYRDIIDDIKAGLDTLKRTEPR